MYSNFVGDIYVGDDGKLHKVQGGADSVLPFKNGDFSAYKIYSGTRDYANTSTLTINIKAKLPNIYNKLNASNFVLNMKSFTVSTRGVSDDKVFTTTFSYNATTGILSYNPCNVVSGFGYFTITNFDIFVLI